MSEARRHPRHSTLKVITLEVPWWVPAMRIGKLPHPFRFEATLHDVSLEGISVRTRLRILRRPGDDEDPPVFDPGTVLQLRIPTVRRALELRAAVAWSRRPSQSSDPWVAGLQLQPEAVDTKTRAAFEEWLETLSA